MTDCICPRELPAGSQHLPECPAYPPGGYTAAGVPARYAEPGPCFAELARQVRDAAKRFDYDGSIREGYVPPEVVLFIQAAKRVPANVQP